MDTNTHAIQKLCNAGLSLVAIPPIDGQPTKAPRSKGWNLLRSANNPKGYSHDATDFANCEGFNFGLAHLPSRTAALDLDALSDCITLFADVGLPLQDWLNDPNRVEIQSGKTNRGKLLFRLPDGVDSFVTRQLENKDSMLFELRNASKTGTTVQDVILGTHPETKTAYKVIGDIRNIPEIPTALLSVALHWDDWMPCFDSALGIEQTPPKIKPRPPQQGEHLPGRRDPIQEFNQSWCVTDVLNLNGYKQSGKDRFIRPGSESKAPGAVILRNCADGLERVFSHGGDVLNDGYAHDAFDCKRLLEHGGDWAAALSWDSEITHHNQQLFKKEKAAKQQKQSHQEPQNDQGESAAPQKTPASTFNETLDNEHKYCTVDLLKHIDDSHLLKRLSKQIAAETHIPVNTVFLMGMAIFSSMAARKYAVLYPNGEQLPIGIYGVAEQPSGSAKSRCLRSFERPFRTIQKKLKDKLATEKKQFDKRDKEKFTEQESEDYKALIKKMNRLSMGLFITNATSEGLETTLAHSQGFFSAISSEQGLFNTLFGNCYKPEGSSNNNDVVLNGFDGGTINSIRAKREGYSGDVVGAIACFAQPGSTEIILKASNGTGLSERFVMLSEPHNLGKRDHTKEVKQDIVLLADYQKCCELLESVINEPLEFEKLNNLTISKDCFLKINKYRNRIEPHLADGGKFSHVSLRGAASKIDMQIMKIAANLHLFDYDFYNVIHERHVTAAIDIADELLDVKLKLCLDKGILGIKAEFTAILSLFENNPKPRTERNIIQAKSRRKPFNEHTSNVSELIRRNLTEMVDQKLLRKQYVPDGAVLYSPGQ